MKERPIIFSGESVRAIQDGRKSMTRRVVKIQPPSIFKHVCGNDPKNRLLNTKGERVFLFLDQPDMGYPFSEVFGTQRFPDNAFKCPYGQVGDRLWVREAWKPIHHAQRHNETYIEYKSPWGRKAIEHSLGMDIPMKWRSPMFMPRWASRITLEITDIRVERLQDITEEDAIKEGFVSTAKKVLIDGMEDYEGLYAMDNFMEEWRNLNAKRGYPWESNPWVWVVEFRRVA